MSLPTIILLLKHYNNQSTINNYDQLILLKDGGMKLMDTAGIRLTPKEIVSKLNEYIVGQNDAKRKVALPYVIDTEEVY